MTDESPHGRLVVGLLTDRDIVTAVVAEEIHPTQIQVEAVMTRDVVTAAETESVSELPDKMRRKGLRPAVGCCPPPRQPVAQRAGAQRLLQQHQALVGQAHQPLRLVDRGRNHHRIDGHRQRGAIAGTVDALVAAHRLAPWRLAERIAGLATGG